jgi:hypothetical protein
VWDGLCLLSWLDPLESSISQCRDPLSVLFRLFLRPFLLLTTHFQPHKSSHAMGDVGRAFRHIIPRTIPPGEGPGGEKSPGGGAGVPPEEAKMKRASTACKECQKRRTRVQTTFQPPFPPLLYATLSLSLPFALVAFFPPLYGLFLTSTLLPLSSAPACRVRNASLMAVNAWQMNYLTSAGKPPREGHRRS